MIWRELLTGILSDFWIATILSLPFFVFEYLPQKSSRAIQNVLATFWILMWGGLTAAHQNYVEYFKFQIIPFHLSYLVDQAFVSANGASLFAASSVMILATSVGLTFWSRKAKTYKKRRRITALFIPLVAVATLAHVFNIRWRVNWFIIEPLQANYLESLYSNMRKKPGIKPLTDDEKSLLKKQTGEPDVLFSAPSPSSRELISIRTEIQNRINQKKPVIIGLIVAESLRETDMGPRATDKFSLTPAIDTLRQKGVHLTNVYSSGPVTRGGQEACWCGTPSATDTSLMRSFPDTKVSCVPALARERRDIRALWFHGGDQRFDSQLAFWTHQGVSRFVTQTDFPPHTPSTGWGISDLALFDRSASLLAELSKNQDVRILMPMILTVSNHIPWAVPEDASLETKNLIVSHPSHRTIRYFDESLDLFIGSLKDKNLWENSVFIITGDHGNMEVPWKNIYGDDSSKWERMLSHVSVTMTGGITEKLRRDGQLPPVVSEYFAQNQIAPFLANLADLSKQSRFMDRPLFEKSSWPVVSDLNQYIFLPETGVKVAKENVLEGVVPPSDQRPWIAATRYRAWLEFLYSAQK